MQHQDLFIDGAWVPAERTRQTHERWTGEPLGQIAVASAADATRAVDAAAGAMARGWPVPERAEVLSRAAGLLADRADELAQLITAEIGKPITAARTEVSRGVETLRLSAEEARRLPGETVALDAVPAGADTLAMTIPVPMGVVAAVTPFNFPLNLVLHKVGPALAAGCAVVMKPSDHAPLTAGAVADLLTEAGLPAGWLNVVTGPPEEIVGALQSDDRVEVVTFTGSSTVGWQLKAAAPRKHHVLELGSNTAQVVAADGDLARAAQAAAAGAMGGSGQACISVQRVYVASAVVEEFVRLLVDEVSAMPVGDPRDPATVVGPLVTDDARDRLQRWIADAVAGGARLVTGGQLVGGVLAPTVLVGVDPASPLVCEEAFGPVVSVIAVDSVDEAIGHVNASRFGLNTAIWTADVATALTFARQAEAGSALVNMSPSFRADHMPYGGVKDSGQGREGVRYAIEGFLRQRLVILHA